MLNTVMIRFMFDPFLNPSSPPLILREEGWGYLISSSARFNFRTLTLGSPRIRTAAFQYWQPQGREPRLHPDRDFLRHVLSDILRQQG